LKNVFRVMRKWLRRWMNSDLDKKPFKKRKMDSKSIKMRL